jgi:hypothetical protein
VVWNPIQMVEFCRQHTPVRARFRGKSPVV